MLNCKMGWHQILGLLCFLFFFLHSSHPFASPPCPSDQHDALLVFKNSFRLDRMASASCPEYYGSYPKTNSWQKGMNCCSWNGVTCDDVSGNVISLDLSCSWLHGALHSNSSLLFLRHLRSLNLSGNNFVGSRILSNLSALAALTHLNLSSSAFSGTVPSEISHFSKLVSLDLSSNYISDTYSFSYLKLENSIFAMLVQNLTVLRKLVLDKVDMSMVSPKVFSNLSSSLTYLSIDSCSLEGIFPETVFRLSSLTTLVASYNEGMSGILPKSNWTSPLQSLSLRHTSFSGEIPNSVGTLNSLTSLDLAVCKFTGYVPSSLADLKSLQVLYIDGNNFSGVLEFAMFAKLKDLRKLMVSQELSVTDNTVKYTFLKLEVLGLSFCNLTEFPFFLNLLKRLSYLDLSFNMISGDIPRWFWGISLDTLEEIDLSHNLLEGGIQQLPWKQLQYIDLRNNSFQGPLPIPPPSTSNFYASNNGFTGEISSSICQLDSLSSLYLSKNNLSGNMPPCFGNMTNLSYLDLSSNKLQGLLPRSLVKCRDLIALYLDDNEFSDIFPHWLEAPHLHTLILTFNKFHGSINLTTFGLSFPVLIYLDISSNDFAGQLPTQVFSNSSLAAIDFSNNNFGGPIPLPSPVTYFYGFARNNITGRITSLICNATELQYFDLSDNGLTGSLSRCLTNFSTHLSVLKLRMNHLEGTIPRSFSWRNSLSTLDLSRNRFVGTLPQSLVKCKYLEILDLSDNQIEDMFPRWLGTLVELKVLILRFNNFKGALNIPKGAHLFPKLHILDLSSNNFGGPLPANLIVDLKAMMNGKNGQDKSLYMTQFFRAAEYENNVTLSIKGQIEPLTILTIFTIIDFSSNSFQGEIPAVIGQLHYLIGLNLSHNQFTGSIPLILGNLTNLEWLDLSSNKLSGGIPRVLGDLASLGYLNLSMNLLTGRIPQDKHLSTFSSDFFSGNPGLCGNPLPKSCPGDAQPTSPSPSSLASFDHKGHESWFEQKEVWIGYASGIVIGTSIAYIVYEMGRPKWLSRGVRVLERRVAEWMKKPKRRAIKIHGQ